MKTKQDGRKNKPQVSVVIPVRNGAKTLAKALDSVLSQDVSLEILVVDDCSQDGTKEVLDRYRTFQNVRIFTNKSSLGAARSRNLGVQNAHGEYVAFLDADDFWAEGKLKKQLALMQSSSFCLCCTARELLRPDGEKTGRVIGVKEQITYRDLLRHNSINCSSVLLKREVAREFPMEHEDSHEDYITWLKILKKYGSAGGINEPLLFYRMTSRGKSGQKWKSAVMTFRVYRYMGFGIVKSLACFLSYTVNGFYKYLTSGWRRAR